MAEINTRAVYEPIIATPVDWVSRKYNIYYISLKSPRKLPGYKKTYWEIWGGWYSMPDSSRVEIYILDWLQQAASFDDILTIPFTFYIDGEAGRLYFNAPKHPWLYEAWDVQLAVNDGYLYTVKDPMNPSDMYIEGDYLHAGLDMPSDNRKLSNPIYSLDLFLSFSIKIDNTSGVFDRISPASYFNRPVKLYKTWKESPAYSDFVMIRTGVVSDVSINKDGITVSCAETFRSLEQNACKIITADEFEIEEASAEGKPLPVIFGTQEITLIKIFDNPVEGGPARFLAAGYITSVIGVYNDDGEPLSFTRSGLVITAPKEAKYASITGYTNNRLGDIVVHLISTTGGIPYINSFWDIEETDAYKNSSPRVNIAITGGTVRSAVTEVLKSDMVFLIQKNNARFTLRRWGAEYGVFSVPEYLHTQQPAKNWKDAQKYWFSACVIKYSKNDRTGGYSNQILLKDNENAIQEKYNRKKQ
jgi:hypothetical protein